jgi:NTP pyrophosphatase (non-canonical NTP hydrolase)
MTNEFIKQLSLNDKKTLSQKALKTCEEVGELAKAVLPFDSAHGTNHRFVDREKILEEIADVHLTNISIAYSLNFTDEEIMDMIHRKSLKWSELQAREEKAQFPLPYEIHITVDGIEMKDPIMCDSKRFDQDYFTKVCKDYLCVKPITLDLEINGGSIRDVMTSSKHFGDNRSAYEESQRIVSRLEECGFEVLRTKIESVPWHPAAPVISTGKEIPNGCYFESHIGVIISPDEKDDLNDFVNSSLTNGHLIELSGKAKLSRNFFKPVKDGKFVNMLTYRSNMCGRPKFQLEVEGIKHLLKEEGFEFEKVEVEYSIYDTNVSHDSAWINN